MEKEKIIQLEIKQESKLSKAYVKGTVIIKLSCIILQILLTAVILTLTIDGKEKQKFIQIVSVVVPMAVWFCDVYLFYYINRAKTILGRKFKQMKGEEPSEGDDKLYEELSIKQKLIYTLKIMFHPRNIFYVGAGAVQMLAIIILTILNLF